MKQLSMRNQYTFLTLYQVNMNFASLIAKQYSNCMLFSNSYKVAHRHSGLQVFYM